MFTCFMFMYLFDYAQLPRNPALTYCSFYGTRMDPPCGGSVVVCSYPTLPGPCVRVLGDITAQPGLCCVTAFIPLINTHNHATAP